MFDFIVGEVQGESFITTTFWKVNISEAHMFLHFIVWMDFAEIEMAFW